MRMPTTPSALPAFATSVRVSAADSAERVDGKVLGWHVKVCRADRLFHVRRAIESLDTFAAPRFITTLAAFAAVLMLLGLFL